MANEWNVSYPLNHTLISDIPVEIRKLKTSVKTQLDMEHETPVDGDATGSEHSNGSAVAYEGTSEPTNRPNGTTALADNAIDRGRLWLDGGIKRWNGSAWVNATNIVNVQSGALTNCPTNIPDDDTIPQKTEGDEVMTLAITPISATNKLKIDVVINVSQEGGLMATVALFQDDTAGALACSMRDMGTANRISTVSLSHYMTAGTTSETTFKIRVGSDAGDANVNGVAAGRYGGGVMISSLTITEIPV